MVAGNHFPFVFPDTFFYIKRGPLALPRKAGYKDKCKIGMDVAASEFKTETLHPVVTDGL